MGTQKKRTYAKDRVMLKGDPPHPHLLSGAHNSREKKLLFRSGDWEKIGKNKGKT